MALISRLVAEAGANVLDILHTRALARTELGEVAIDFVVETRGADHLGELMDVLARHVRTQDLSH